MGRPGEASSPGARSEPSGIRTGTAPDCSQPHLPGTLTQPVTEYDGFTVYFVGSFTSVRQVLTRRILEDSRGSRSNAEGPEAHRPAAAHEIRLSEAAPKAPATGGWVTDEAKGNKGSQAPQGHKQKTFNTSEDNAPFIPIDEPSSLLCTEHLDSPTHHDIASSCRIHVLERKAHGKTITV